MRSPLASLAAALAVIALGAALASTAPAPAQGQAGVTEVEFVQVPGERSPELHSRGSVTLRVAGETCVTHVFTADDPSPLVLVGGDEQPAVCSDAGEYIRFYDAGDRLLAVKLRVTPGERLEFVNWIPWHAYSEAGAGLALDRPISPGLMVLADGVPCWVIRFAPGDPDEVDLGLAGRSTPEECAREGAELRFIAAEGVYLRERATLRFDHPIILRDATTIPPTEDAPPEAQLESLRALLTCLNIRVGLEGSSIVRFDDEGRGGACDDPALPVPARLTFDVPNERLIPGAVIVLANNTPCLLLGIPAVGTYQVDVGTEAQPRPCRIAGAELSFIDGHGLELFSRLVLEAGADLAFTNWAPVAPHGEESGQPDFGAYLGNITRCYRLFEGGTGERVLLLPAGDDFPSCPEELRQNLRPPTTSVGTGTPGGDATPAATSEPSFGDSRRVSDTDTTAALRALGAAVVVALVLAVGVTFALGARSRRRG